MRRRRFRKFLPITGRVVRNARRKGVTVYTRRQWGSKFPGIYAERRTLKPHFLLPQTPADTLIHHITVTLDHGPLSSDFFTDMQTIERIGVERFYSGVSYNWVIDMETGEVGLGQDLDVKGTHTVNDKEVPGYSHDQNGVGLAIAFLGMPGQQLTRAAVNSCVQLTAAMIEEEALTETYDSVPHSLFAWKDCPTDAVRTMLPRFKIRALTIAKGV